MKVEIALKQSNRLINCGEVILVSSASKGKANIITLAWHMPVSQNPPLVAISVAKSHFSHQLIKEAEEFVINIPTMDLLSKVTYCGTHSGSNLDKFEASGLTKEKANRLVKSPLIKECCGHLECCVRDIKDYGDHSIFVGEVIYTTVEDSLFKEVWEVEKAQLIFHLGGKFFTQPGKTIQAN